MLTKLIQSKNIRNSFWNILEVLLSPLFFFVTLPIFLEWLGDQEYGVWMFTNTLIMIMMAFNLGLNTATYKHSAVHIGNENWKSLQNCINTNVSLSILILLFCLFVGALLVLGIREYAWFLDGQTDPNRLAICVFIGMGLVFTKLCEQIFYNVFRAFEDFHYVTWINLGIKAVIVFSNLIVAFYIRKVEWILLTTLICSFIGIAISYTILKRKIPQFHFRFVLDKDLVRTEISFALFTWLQSVIVIFAYNGDRLLVSHWFGMTMLSYYAIVATLFNHIHMVFGAITPWLLPKIAKSKANLKDKQAFYLNVRNVSLCVSLLLMVCFSFVAEWFLGLWLGADKFAPIENFLCYFLMFETFFIYTHAPFYYLNAAGNERFLLKYVAIYASLHALGFLIAYYSYQSIGNMVLGSFLGTVAGMYILHRNMNRNLFGKIESEWRILLLFVPPSLGIGVAFFDAFSLKVLFLALFLISLYLIFIKIFKTDFKAILE